MRQREITYKTQQTRPNTFGLPPAPHACMQNGPVHAITFSHSPAPTRHAHSPAHSPLHQLPPVQPQPTQLVSISPHKLLSAPLVNIPACIFATPRASPKLMFPMHAPNIHASCFFCPQHALTSLAWSGLHVASLACSPSAHPFSECSLWASSNVAIVSSSSWQPWGGPFSLAIKSQVKHAPGVGFFWQKRRESGFIFIEKKIRVQWALRIDRGFVVPVLGCFSFSIKDKKRKKVRFF